MAAVITRVPARMRSLLGQQADGYADKMKAAVEQHDSNDATQRWADSLADASRRKRLHDAQYAVDHAERKRVMREHARPERVRMASHEAWREMFARDGADMIYEALATGDTMSSYAVKRGFPVFLFREWCRDNLSRASVMEARRAAADLAAYESVSVLDDPDAARSMPAVHHARALAQAKLKLAERGDAEMWGPPKAVLPSPAPVSLVIAMGDTSLVPAAEIARVARLKADKIATALPVFDPLATDLPQDVADDE